MCGLPAQTAAEPAVGFVVREIIVDGFGSDRPLSATAAQWPDQRLSVTAGDGPAGCGSSPVSKPCQGCCGWAPRAFACRWSGVYVADNGN